MTGKVMVRPVDDWPQDQMALVGQIVAAFSHVERGLHNTPKRMRKEKWDVYATWDARFSVSDRVAQILVEGEKLLSPEQFKRLREVMDRAEQANNERNEVVHALWGKWNDKKGARFNGKPIDVSVKRLGERLNFIKSVAGELGSDWKKWAPPTAQGMSEVRQDPRAKHFKAFKEARNKARAAKKP